MTVTEKCWEAWPREVGGLGAPQWGSSAQLQATPLLHIQGRGSCLSLTQSPFLWSPIRREPSPMPPPSRAFSGPPHPASSAPPLSLETFALVPHPGALVPTSAPCLGTAAPPRGPGSSLLVASELPRAWCTLHLSPSGTLRTVHPMGASPMASA